MACQSAIGADHEHMLPAGLASDFSACSSKARPKRSICATEFMAHPRNGSQPMICSNGDIRYKTVRA